MRKLTTEERTKLVEIARTKNCSPNLIAEIAMGTEKQVIGIMYRLTGKTLQRILDAN